jgi:hypothetical protein
LPLPISCTPRTKSLIYESLGAIPKCTARYSTQSCLKWTYVIGQKYI